MITPILLCGGSGTRLWPLSRKSYPKQFTSMIGSESLFQSCARRFSGAGFQPPLVITAEDFRFIVNEQLDDLGILPSGVTIEPKGKDTAPAALLGALQVMQKNPKGLILLTPCDHAITDPKMFRDAVKSGVPAAQDGKIVTFGIKPTRPETGYGWLLAGEETHPNVQKLVHFVEKPNASTVQALYGNKQCWWNSGVFLCRADVLVSAYKILAPDVLEAVQSAIDAATPDLDFTRIDPDIWERVNAISIDYAIMEKAQNVSVVRFDGAWSDLGSWESVWQETPKDKNGNGLSGSTTALECENSLLRSESDQIELVGIGLKNVVAIAMRDAVMVADISDSQNVKTAVKTLQAQKIRQSVQLPVDHRPWGWFETLTLSGRFQVKQIHVKPGGVLSLQSHAHRAEHWVVVEGTAKVTLDDEVQLLSENQSIYVPLGAKHRLENPGNAELVLIEIQTGSYFGEDDIVRYEDKYARMVTA